MRSWGTSVQPCTCWHVAANQPACPGDDRAAYAPVTLPHDLPACPGDDRAAYAPVTLLHDLPAVLRR